MLNDMSIDLDQPIETSAGRAAKQVDVTEMLLQKLTAGFEPSPELLKQAQGLGVDVEAIRAMVNELYGEDEDD